MSKGIEWLKKEIENMPHTRFKREGMEDYILISKSDVLEYLDQLDEPEVTREQVVEWIGNNEFYCHATAEAVLENAVDKGELGYYGTKYSVVKKEPETVADVVTTFWKSYERLKEVMSMEVEELEE